MSKHVGYVAASHEELSTLIHSPGKSRLRVCPNIISAYARIPEGAAVYEVTITLDEGQSFYAARDKYSSELQFETYFDAFSAAENGSVCVRDNRSRAVTEIAEHVSVGPRVALV